MKNLGTTLAAVFLAVVLLLYMCTFQVRFTEVAIIKTWGKPAPEPITEPGLHGKWPRPIQNVVVYDKRLRILEDRTEQTRTVDGKTVLLTTFTIWRISDPAKFHTNFPGGEEDGVKKLRTTVIAHKHAVTGQREFSEFVSTDPARRRIHEIEEAIRVAVAQDAREEYGIEIVDFGIKKLGLPESVTAEIFSSMKSLEGKKAAGYLAEGEATASDLLANAQATYDRIMAEARRKAAEIRTEADTLVSEYYKEFEGYPHLRIFLDSLRTLRNTLQSRTTLILSDDESPWNAFSDEARRRVPMLDGVLGQAAPLPSDPANTQVKKPE